jgi:hypothetical protein
VAGVDAGALHVHQCLNHGQALSLVRARVSVTVTVRVSVSGCVCHSVCDTVYCVCQTLRGTAHHVHRDGHGGTACACHTDSVCVLNCVRVSHSVCVSQRHCVATTCVTVTVTVGDADSRCRSMAPSLRLLVSLRVSRTASRLEQLNAAQPQNERGVPGTNARTQCHTASCRAAAAA